MLSLIQAMPLSSVPQVNSLPAAEPTDSDSSVPVIKPKPALTLGLNARPSTNPLVPILFFLILI